MKHSLFTFLFCSIAFIITAQKYTLSGVMTDAETGDPLIGATVQSGGIGVLTDIDGNYSIELDGGEQTVVFSYLGYESKEEVIDLQSDQRLNIRLGSSSFVLKEVEVVSDIAIERETPVAFSNIPTKKIEEELAAQDIPMVLNSTPGAYATEGGGGDGDARITIRGFDQRNIAVMLDGIPVNDMENGWVFWSNWFGLDLVTQTMQVQRGLGASKLSVPSVGGTINILTKGIDAKRSLRFRQEIGNNGFLRSTLGLTTGRLANGWGVSVAGSYKQGDGWVDGNFTKGYFYYLRVDKQLGNHLISLTGFGAPQEHGQRSFSAEIGQVDAEYAEELGVPASVNEQLTLQDKGRRFSEFWGYQNGKAKSERKNYYHKPQFSLRHSWQASDRLFWSNVVYLSIGNGGGTADDGASIPRDSTGVLDFDKAFENNKPTAFNPDGLSNTILRANVNNHFWYGLLSTVNYDLTSEITLSGGIDGRYYEGEHYREVYDLLGGNGFGPDKLQEGDRYFYDYTGFVRWLGAFALMEYKTGPWSAFVNLSAASTSYKAVDNMVDFELDWITHPSATIKVGASYRLDRNQSVFINTGLLNKVQPFRNVILTNATNEANPEATANYENEKIKAVELGYTIASAKFSANVNAYYTRWENKPLDRLPTVPLDEGDPDSDRIPVNIPGVDALHQGIEIDFAYQPIKSLAIEGLASFGDWTWNSRQIATVALPNGVNYEYEFDAKGVHVGDAAQVQVGGLIRYEPIKGLYFKLKGVHFAKNYAAFQPEDLKGETAGMESWQLPDYTLFFFHAGYSFRVGKNRCSLRANIINLFDTVYISDARNNDGFNSPAFNDFDAKSASVHFGQGRRWTASFQISF